MVTESTATSAVMLPLPFARGGDVQAADAAAADDDDDDAEDGAEEGDDFCGEFGAVAVVVVTVGMAAIAA